MSGFGSLLEYNEIVRQMFGNEEEGFQFYNNYAKEKGFSVRRSYCEWDSGHNEITLRKFVCSREGFREEMELKRESKKRKPRNITRVGCRAKLVIARDQSTEQWYVKDFIGGHNHPMAEPDVACLLRSHRRISDDQKAEILEMQISGIRKHQIMDIVQKQYGGYDKVGYTMRDLYNFCHRNKLETVAAGDAQTVISYLTECKRRDPDFFFQYKTDREGHLKGLIWCDCQCRLDYRAFGDVVVFDSTYKTNRYNLPLVPFVGVNHHGSTVLFACGIVAQETIESYVWLLSTLSDAMAQKHPVSVITDGDLAMQRAIRVVWPNSSHRLCIWHIEQNIVRNLHDDGVKNDFRYFLYDCCSIEELEMKWLEFLDKHNVTDQESWLYQMYERREIWCAAYHAGKCYLGLRSNQRSESLNSRLQRNSEPMLQLDASTIEKEAAKMFTPGVFAKVQFSIKAGMKCFMREHLDGYDLQTYIVGRVDKGDKEYFVKCEICVDEGTLKRISCSCLKLQSLGTPCSHIFFVLGYRDERKLPECCVLKRWTMGAKSAFPPIRKSTMYDYSDSLQRYRELRNISHTASFVASRSPEAYERLKRVLHEEAAMVLPNGGENGGNKFGPVLPQAQHIDSTESTNVLDPMHVPGRGAPKKKVKSVSNKKKSTEIKLPEDVLDI
ncbi:protein FAR1-RELATED SEQUENCE 5 [Sorghum bicolor]|uniref:protein FAR1-RELATED SEQUENCE 5 n=1 Tax=Sorghum bicolor TaxID=4558 RepID=UPI000B425EDA|nr:protein FAR1-RELATED SEQUENCE 5 [Sorghum bicolor]|eukprot:XP_002450570.2 protein FAR1-RELATED SEQUENCE 5 [Sorghum bicolor]